LEDLRKMAGAGLFDSILNVDLDNQEALMRAIVDVWISLFSERAVQSRKQMSIPSE
jgi:phosphoenolpyruvate synthase/pyruvate phosphate dikinase